MVEFVYAQTLDRPKLDQFFDRLAEKRKAMGSLVIAKDGNVLYTRAIGYGQINGTEKKPLSADSRFRIASITKMFTAVMILQLVEEERLKLGDTLDQFFPQIPNAPKITIAQILAHRSGIPNSRPASKTNAVTKEELLALIAKGTPEFEPGTKHSYSNAGFFILGLLVERVTAQSYQEALQERITFRIGAKDTYSASGEVDVTKNETLAYFHLGGDWKQETEIHSSILFGGGQIVSTPIDLAKFIQALFDLKLVSQETLRQMKTMRDGEGLGMTTFTFAGKTFYGETGGGDNRGAWLAYEPEEKLTVAYATNAKIYPVTNIVSGVVDIYYHRPFQIPALESIAVPPDVLERYVGIYSAAGAPAKAIVTRDGSTLFFQPPGAASAVPLEAMAEDKFQIEGVAVFTFDVTKSQMSVKRRVGERVFTKEK
ncbi:MAG: serine hydrolase domain-containing protein [Verrucomicrobiota bacterium]